MSFLKLAAAAALALTAVSAQTAGLPDLGGRTVTAVTENAYTPLNFADPNTGEGIGWEYDAFNEIAKRLNLKVEWQLSSWDTMIQDPGGARGSVRHRHGRHHDHRRTQAAGGFFRSLYGVGAVHAGAWR